MNSLYLIASIAGSRVAIDSENVESVVTVQDIIPVPKSDPCVAGLFALRSRVLTLIDSQFLVTGVSTQAATGSLAVIADIAGHHYGLLVDSVEDVVSIDGNPVGADIRPSKTWENLVVGTVLVNGEMVMQLDPAQLVAGSDAMAA